MSQSGHEEDLAQRRQDAKEFLGEFCALARVSVITVSGELCIGVLGIPHQQLLPVPVLSFTPAWVGVSL